MFNKREDIKMIRSVLKRLNANVQTINHLFAIINRIIFNQFFDTSKNKCEIYLESELSEKELHNAYGLTKRQFTLSGMHLASIYLYCKTNTYDAISVLIHECIHAYLFFTTFDQETIGICPITDIIVT